MRPYTVRHLLAAVLVVAAVLPTSALAGIYFNLGFGIGCGGCGLRPGSCLCPPCTRCYAPPASCVCPPPAAPVLPPATCVPQTEIRRQAYIEQVPITTYQQITETVYVPQQVTRTVPRTVLTQQMRYRDVAVQTMQPMVSQFPPIVPAAGCSSCGSNSIGFAPAAIPGYPGVLPTAAPAAIPSMPAISVSPYGTPSVVPQYDDVGWTNVRPRSAPTPSSSHAPVRGASMFRPAPSAATVWQSRF